MYVMRSTCAVVGLGRQNSAVPCRVLPCSAEGVLVWNVSVLGCTGVGVGEGSEFSTGR